MSPLNTPTNFERRQLYPAEDRVDVSSELQTLHEISRTILDSLDLKVMMEGILNKAAAIGGFDIGMICFVTAVRQTLEPVAHCGFRDHENLTTYREHMREQSTAGIVDRVIATKEIRVVDLHKTGGIRTFRREDVRSLVVVPLRTDQDALGVMYLGSRQAREFEPSHIRLFEAVGTQAGIAVQKVRLFEAVERRAKEQEALNVIATATSQSLELKELFEIAADKTVMVTERQRINFRLKDSLTGKIDLVAYRGFTDAEIEALRRITPHPMSEEVFASGRPLVINDHVGPGVSGLLARTQSVAWIPVKAGSKVVGVLGISDDQSRPFTPNEVELLQAIGSVIGVAIENARLFQERETRNRDLSALHDVTAAASRSLEIKPVLDEVLKKITEIFKFDRVSIFLFDPKRETLTRMATFGIAQEETGARAFRRGQGLTGKVAETGQYMVFEDVRSDPRYRQLSQTNSMQQLGACFFALFPIKAKERFLGTINCIGKEPRKLKPDEIRLINSMCDQIGVAVENINLFEQVKNKTAELESSNSELREALEQQTATGEVLRVIASSPTELQPVLDTLLANAVKLSGATKGHIRQYDGEFLRYVAHYNESPDVIDALNQLPQRPRPESMGTRALTTRQAIHVLDA